MRHRRGSPPDACRPRIYGWLAFIYCHEQLPLRKYWTALERAVGSTAALLETIHVLPRNLAPPGMYRLHAANFLNLPHTDDVEALTGCAFPYLACIRLRALSLGMSLA